MNIIQNVIDSLLPWWGTISAFIFILGLFMFVSGFILLAKDQGPRGQGALFASVGSMLAGLMLMNSMPVLDMLGQTLFQESSAKLSEFEALSDGTDSTNPASVYLTFAFQVVQLVGLIAFANGCWLLKIASSNPQTSWFKAITHIVGGFIAINHKVFLQTFGETLGGDMEGLINNIISIAY